MESEILDADFTEEEVLYAIKDLGNDKAPGPDSFPIMFFQKCWYFIEEDIMSTVNKFCASGTIDSKHNSTFITQVPKKDHIETVKDCRPICLLTSVYKIIAKVLASRIKLVMDKLISHVQCSYIEGREIIDGTVIANELVDSRLRSGNAVLINGSSFGYFNSSRGVRQGAPVSPLLFNTTMEGFSIFMDRASNQALQCFEFIAGLKVNTSKTRLVAVGDVPDLYSWATKLGCSIDTLPFIYLGMTLGAKSGSKGIWDPIIEKFDARLSPWRKISLSKGDTTSFGVSGRDITFWFDTWCGQIPLATAFPNLHKLATNKYIKLADMISPEGGWKFDIKRVLTNAEVDAFATLLIHIGDSPPVTDALPDTRRWSLNTSGTFSVKTLYEHLYREQGIDEFPYSFTWKSVVPPKVNFLMWCIIHGKLNTIDILQCKGVHIYNCCVLWGDDFETQDHLFLHCKVARKIWMEMLPSNWCWVFPRSMFDLAKSWQHLLLSSSGKTIWELMPAAIIWVLWNERNCRIFESKYNFKTDSDLLIDAKTLVLTLAAASW
ncbi:uncharacterized protein LOC113316705 [Papaver somniferum]|uniref:uncharacterized protein LOC113316705 n=1 Tax=Papaver somniferum TaxID=3469 RepID=UPI000E700D5C|nr:uncharacterized protein LOC113316705 [Papaver somniferum]